MAKLDHLLFRCVVVADMRSLSAENFASASDCDGNKRVLYEMVGKMLATYADAVETGDRMKDGCDG